MHQKIMYFKHCRANKNKGKHGWITHVIKKSPKSFFRRVAVFYYFFYIYTYIIYIHTHIKYTHTKWSGPFDCGLGFQVGSCQVSSRNIAFMTWCDLSNSVLVLLWSWLFHILDALSLIIASKSWFQDNLDL